MQIRREPGLGELLRYLSELVDAGAAQHYRSVDLSWRPRYTPVLRALLEGNATVTEIVAHSRLTQGAVSQTVALMITDGLLTREGVEDGRKSALRLTHHGQALTGRLRHHWQQTFAAIETLEAEIGHPLRRVLEDAADALERQGFAERLKLAVAEEKDE